MDTISVNKFSDWEREQESLYVLQNKDLMQQISESISTHSQNNIQGKGYQAKQMGKYMKCSDPMIQALGSANQKR